MRNYAQLLVNRNVQAFLALIRFTEGAGYRTMFGGEQCESLSDHPRRAITRTLGGKPITSTAAGAYQFLSRTWDECAAALNLCDFGPHNQDVAALFLIDRRGALDHVIAGQWKSAILGCNKEWASLPGSPYGQPTKTMDKCLAFIDTQIRQAPEVAAPPPLTPKPQPNKVMSWLHSLLQHFRR
jgi:muramidase (phage lysozyme)